jgi:hypothetical protein
MSLWKNSGNEPFVTLNIPPGKGGHAEARVRISETWLAADPGLWTLLIRAINDAPGAKTTTELISVTRVEPDAAVFRPPDDYQIVNRGAPPCPAEQAFASVRNICTALQAAAASPSIQ